MRVLALDLGERRIGVAVSDPTGTVARPVGVVERKSRAEDFAAIARMVAEYGAERVIVGQPLTLRGEVGPQARWVEAYAQALAEALPVPVELWDERYTTIAAQEILETVRRPGKRRRRGEVDAVAAAVLLQGFLETCREREDDLPHPTPSGFAATPSPLLTKRSGEGRGCRRRRRGRGEAE